MVTRCLTLRDATTGRYEEVARCYRVSWCEWRGEPIFVEVLFLPMTTVRSSSATSSFGAPTLGSPERATRLMSMEGNDDRHT